MYVSDFLSPSAEVGVGQDLALASRSAPLWRPFPGFPPLLPWPAGLSPVFGVGHMSFPNTCSLKGREFFPMVSLETAPDFQSWNWGEAHILATTFRLVGLCAPIFSFMAMWAARDLLSSCALGVGHRLHFAAQSFKFRQPPFAPFSNLPTLSGYPALTSWAIGVGQVGPSWQSCEDEEPLPEVRGANF